MVDMTEISKVHGSPESAKRLGRRKMAEIRLQAYGILAIFAAGAALVILLWSTFVTARFALSETYVTLPINLSQEAIDPENTRDPAVIRQASFPRIVRDSVREAFPYVTGRTDRRALADLYSGGSGYELRDEVMADPSMIGQTIEYRLLASDVVDLYMKGEFGALEEQANSAAITLSFIDEETVFLTADSDIFTPALALVREDLADQAVRVRDEAARQNAGVEAFERIASAAASDEDRAAAQAEVSTRTVVRDNLLTQAEDLERRSRDVNTVEALQRSNPSLLFNVNGGWLKLVTMGNNTAEAKVVVPMDELVAQPETYQFFVNPTSEQARPIDDNKIVWIETLRAQDRVEEQFNWRFFQSGDSRDPELAGIWGAAVGSFWTMLVTFVIAFPVGVLAAIYLEEFAPKNRITDFIEVNINNLAAVPSIVFGLLGLSVFLGVFGMPRSAPVAGGFTLALMTLPTIIIASRAAIRAVPPSIRDAALGLGASEVQTAFHHVLPLAMPGILTGTIIGMAQALGETAPLILIGMVAFIVEIPGGVTDPATVLPVQVFRWSDFPERAFEARTAAAICVLLFFLVLMNAFAVFLRKRFERRW